MNPALREDVFRKEGTVYSEEAMTTQGSVIKTAILLCCVLVTAFWTWTQFYSAANLGLVQGLMMVGAIGGFITAIVTVFKHSWAPYTAPLYSLLQGFFIGGLSAVMEMQFPGLVIQAVALTFGVMLAMLLAYQSGLVKVTDSFRLGIVAATGGIAIVYFVGMILSFFGTSIPFIHGNGAIGIGFSLVVVGIAALNLVLDFDFIQQGERARAPKYMEWYAAFGLMVTLIWLYIEMLRLLSKLNSRR